MKKINLMIIAILASAMAFMTSCDDETITPAPTVTITGGNQTVMPNTDVEIAYTVTAAGEIDEISFLKDGGSYGTPITNGFETDTTHAGVVTIPAGEDNFTFTVSVIDKDEKTQQATVNITIDDVIVKSTDAIKLYTAPADQSGTEARFASLTDFTGYSWASAQGNEANIDMVYYNGSYTKGSTPHFASPDFNTTDPDIVIHNDEILNGAKITYFAVLEGDDAALFTDWDNIDDDTAINSITTTLVDKNVTWTTGAGTIIAFELADGKKGVIKVGAAVDGNDNGLYYDAASDYIEFDVIVQKYAPATTK